MGHWGTRLNVSPDGQGSCTHRPDPPPRVSDMPSCRWVARAAPVGTANRESYRYRAFRGLWNSSIWRTGQWVPSETNLGPFKAHPIPDRAFRFSRLRSIATGIAQNSCTPSPLRNRGARRCGVHSSFRCVLRSGHRGCLLLGMPEDKRIVYVLKSGLPKPTTTSVSLTARLGSGKVGKRRCFSNPADCVMSM